MGTPFITFMEPTPLDDYVLGSPGDQQPASIPKVFVDAMEVRTEVFVKEQNVPAENEFDSDDPRCCHWVAYASVNKVVQEEVRDDQGNVVTPRRSSTTSTPIGVIRCVPFPHEPHPVPGGEYWNGKLTATIDEKGERTPVDASFSSPSNNDQSGLPNPATEEEGESGGGVPGGEATVGAPPPHHAPDRATSLHDGREPYVKLGRMAVTKEFRGHGIAKLVVAQALSWLKAHPRFFDPSVAEKGLDGVGAWNEKDIPKWKGLVCVHAQEQVVKAWEKLGFEIDEGMGRWMEEGIWHRGMFLRLDIGAGEEAS